ncbi:MAG TPA: DUF1353 domain-containing protein [Acetobacteraceae bacterium]|jgi:hypothetical protein|nr:DUF1353 domain-containing protein [Acetobacteraceae bacterium]
MFQTRLYVRDMPTQDMWVVVRPFVWTDSEFGTIEVPVGMMTDLASIPRALRNVPELDPDGASRRAAVCHDFLYDRAAGRAHGKDFADRFLHAAMLADGCGNIAANLFYEAVKEFGRSSWDAWTLDLPLLDP